MNDHAREREKSGRGDRPATLPRLLPAARLRSTRERIIQSLWYEAIGLALSLPAFLAVFGGEVGHGIQLLAAVSLPCILWAPLHNTAFDWIELRLSGRTACQRPRGLRILHAVSQEATSIMITLPILMLFGGFGFLEALIVDVALTIFCIVYAFVFHLGYDRLCPVLPTAGPMKLDRQSG